MRNIPSPNPDRPFLPAIDIDTRVGVCPHHTRTQTPEQLIAMLDQYDIASAVTYRSEARLRPDQFNAVMRRDAAGSGGRIRYCCILDPGLGAHSLPGEGDLRARLLRERPVAVRVEARSAFVPFTPFFFEHICCVLNELCLPLLIPADELDSYDQLREMAEAFPDMPLVLLHGAMCRTRALEPLLRKLPNFYADFGVMLSMDFLEDLSRAGVGMRQIMIGSGLPAFVPAGSLAVATYANIPLEDRRAILAGTWERLESEIRYDNL
ncbi:MAG: hypothetical protein GX900_05655 [Clostridiaceae bacterium]|nr:hypothetical protein [Clostridiaceae bacterium]